jgi:uncharacterized protein (DUF885 family)
MHFSSMLGAVVLSAALGAMSLLAPAFGQGTDPSAQANALFDEYWLWVLREYPDFATLYFGDHRYDDRLRDESAAAVLARAAAAAAFRKRSDQIDAARLPAQERVSLRILQFRLDAALAINKGHGSLPFGVLDSWAPVTQMRGLHLDLPQLAQAARFRSVADYEAWLKRLDAVPGSVSQLIERMTLAMAAGWVPPKVAIAGVPQQLDAQLVDDVQKSPEYAPFKSFPKDMPPAEQSRLKQAGERAIRGSVIPAFRSLKSFYETRYLGSAAQRLGLSNLPGGPAYYQAWLDWNTTTRLTPRQIHDLGLAEVARIGAQMDAIVAASGFKGTRAQFQEFLTTDPQFFFTKPQDMLAGYRDIAKRADAALPALFAELPRQTYGIRAMPPEEGNNAERYMPGSQDGGRPGWFEANVNDLKTRPKWTMETLLLHEAVPGHHLQIARAQELGQLPAFRRYTWFVAFGEGWALYAESLGDEMGFFKDPHQKFGNLSFEMLRACRLVVDTGLHAFGWSREQAIDYMVENSGLTRADVTAEVDRYLVLPGQATAYKIGELKIKELRAKAKARLGERFDLRRFHNAIIDNGAVPLAVLDQSIDDWIASETTGAPAK